MTHSTISRRKVALGGAAAIAMATGSRHAFAAHPMPHGGFSPARLAKIPAMLQSYVDDGSSVGFVTLLYRHGEIAQVSATGFQDREAKLPMKRDTIFRLASMTKPVTAVAALTLMEQGKIGLHDPIDKWLPELANPKVLNSPTGPLEQTHASPRAITLADLLTHRSGIVGQFNTGPAAAAAADIRKNDPTFDVWLKRLGAIPLVYDPGAQFNYGTSFDVLGALVQRLSGQSFGDYLKTAIFDPLGMKDTAFWMPQDKQHRIAAIYGADPETGKPVPIARPVPTSPPNFASGAGALLSTADDYLQFARMLLGKGRVGDVRILSHPTVALMTTNWLTAEQRKTGAMGIPTFWAGQGFGLGVSVTDDPTALAPFPFSSKGSFSWPGATGVWWRVDPEEDMIGIFMVQTATAPTNAAQLAKLPQQMAAARTTPAVAFFDLAYDAIDG